MKHKKKRKHSPVEIDTFWRMRAEGWTYQAIADETGVSVWTLHDWNRFATQVRINLMAARKWGLCA